MTHAPAPPALVVRGPDSLPALVPHLVGFHPSASLVLLGLVPERRTVRVTVRIDLPEEGAPLADAVDAWSTSIAALRRAGALEAVLVVYPRPADSPWRSAEPGELPHHDLVDRVAESLRDADVLALDAVCVVGDRLRSYWCLDLACCPPEGRVADSGEALRVRSALVEQGSAPLASREDLVRALSPREPDDPVRRAVEEARDGIVIRMPAGTEQRVERFVDDVRDLDLDPRNHAVLTRLVVTAGWLCATIRSRDLLLRALTLDPDPDVVNTARTVLGEAVRCASGTDVAPVASVLAVCAWVTGDGAAARVALDRALDADPTYSLAALVEAALDAGTPPWSWVELMGGISVAAILGQEGDAGLAAGA
jgi:hypothetical protein